MSLLDRLDVSPSGFVLVAALLFVLLAASAWLDATPRRHAPNVLVVSGVGLLAVTVAAFADAPVAVIVAILLVWAAALAAFEGGWVLRERARHPRAPGAGRTTR